MTQQRRGGLTLAQLRELRGDDWPNRPRPKRDPSDRWLAPLRGDNGVLEKGVHKPWEGRSKVKPWEHRVTAAIVHLDTPDLLEVVVGLLRCQTVKPYIVVVDTGSHACHRERVLGLEGEDLETVWLRPRGWHATSQAVATAMDCAMAVTQTEFLYATHVDVFLTKRDYLAHLVERCDGDTPIVGWQMSPRPSWPEPLWREIPSHTATLYHVPTVRALGLSWSMLAAFDRLGLSPHQPSQTGWPDTEVNFGLGMLDQGFRRWDIGMEAPDGRRWLCLGPEPNEPYETEWFEHVRSTTSHRLFGSAGQVQRGELLSRAMESARERVRRWNKPRVPLGQKPCKPCESKSRD